MSDSLENKLRSLGWEVLNSQAMMTFLKNVQDETRALSRLEAILDDMLPVFREHPGAALGFAAAKAFIAKVRKTVAP